MDADVRCSVTVAFAVTEPRDGEAVCDGVGGGVIVSVMVAVRSRDDDAVPAVSDPLNVKDVEAPTVHDHVEWSSNIVVDTVFVGVGGGVTVNVFESVMSSDEVFVHVNSGGVMVVYVLVCMVLVSATEMVSVIVPVSLWEGVSLSEGDGVSDKDSVAENDGVWDSDNTEE